MKTSLHFEAPSDLSVGSVRITSGRDTIIDWIATPDNRTFQREDLKPGVYSAEISPAGVSPQSVLFEVREGHANNVILPSFSALSSSGSNTSFFDTASQQTLSDIPDSKASHILSKLELPSYQGESFSAGLSEGTPRLGLHQVNISKDRRRVSLGLSEEKPDRESFATFRGQSRLELLSGRVEIEIATDPRRDYWGGRRVRLSAAIEQVRVERCLLPLYRGGTRITVTAPPLAPADLELSILPVDPKLRALVRGLDAGTSAEVAAIRDNVLDKSNPSALLKDEADPWAAILFALLAIRFPALFKPIDSAWAEALVHRAGWAFDAHVIRASQMLSATGQVEPAAQDLAVAKAVVLLAKAQAAGSPYYRYTNQLFGEIAAGIADYLQVRKPLVDAAAIKKFDRLYRRWHRELPLQRGAGLNFTWLAHDPTALKKHGLLTPYRFSSGKLHPRDTYILFEGQVTAGQIDIKAAAPSSLPVADEIGALSTAVERSADTRKYALAAMPALARRPGPKDDPNKGRFGGQATRGGFSLSASFEKTSRNWVTVILLVEADRSTNIGLGDFAWFILHPTFSPSALKVMFRGHRARLRIQAWGGFTVGVWMPQAGIELESDLSQIKTAPKIIKLR